MLQLFKLKLQRLREKLKRVKKSSLFKRQSLRHLLSKREGRKQAAKKRRVLRNPREREPTKRQRRLRQ